MRKFIVTCVAAAAALAAGSGPLQAQSQPDLATMVRKALDSNPEVTARLNSLRASGEAVNVARGAWRPRVDLEAEVGRARDSISSRNPESATLGRSGVALSASQLLWDGRAEWPSPARSP